MMECVCARRTTKLRLTALLMATTLAALPVRAQERPPATPPQEGSAAKPRAQADGPVRGAAPQAADTLPVSIASVRERLKAKPSITAPLPKADFTVRIEERRPLQEMFDVPPWATSPLAQSRPCPPRGASYLPSPNCGSPAGFGFDPGSLIGSVRGAINARAARDEVRRTIIEYCAAQPNGGAGIKICADEAR
jgi:hypothetical protein